MRIFINHTNHASSDWGEQQKDAADKYGVTVDISFPTIPSTLESNRVKELAKKTFEAIRLVNPEAVLCQGEFTYTYELVRLLKDEGIKVLAACSERVAHEVVRDDGTVEKKSEFKFVRFREY